MSRTNILLVLAAIFLAVIAGLFTQENSTFLGVKVISLYDLIGNLFLNALKLVIVPLVVSSIITGVAKMGEEEKMAALGGKTFGFYFLTTFSAAIVGYICVMLIAPGIRQETSLFATAQKLAEVSFFDKIVEIIYKLLPQNIIQAAAEGQMLGLIVFSMMFGFFTSKIEPQFSGTLQSFFKGVFQVMMKMTHFIIKFLPLGVFALVAKVVALSGLDAIRTSAWFFTTMCAAYIIYGGVVLPLFLKLWGVNPLKHFQAMGPALLTAFTTSSSAATLPVTLECVEKRAGVSNRIAGFTLPLGTSIHMAGTAIFECVAVIFIAQAFGIELTLSSQILVVILSVLMSMGIAGIPSASLVAVVVMLNIMDLPAEGLALLLVVERILDMLRTVMNVFSNSVNTVLIARSEKEHTALI